MKYISPLLSKQMNLTPYDDIVEISGTVNLNGDISYNVSSNVDLPELDAIGKVELLYDVGAIDEVERIEKYIEIYEDGTSGWEYPKVCVNLQTDVR